VLCAVCLGVGRGLFLSVDYWLGDLVSVRSDSDAVLYDIMSDVLRVHDQKRRDSISGSLRPKVKKMMKQDRKGLF